MKEANDLSASRSTLETPKPPPPTTRLDFLLVRIDRFFARCDGFMNRWLPEEYNPLARSGAAANLALLITVVSGIFMLIWYRSSVQFAYSSIEGLSDYSLGGWVRSLHRYSSDLTMLFLFIHAGRTFVARKFTGSRWLPWVSGIIMCTLIWFIGWTGYWLIWDQPAQQIAMSTMQFVDLFPIFGEPMSRLFVVDRLVPSLLFFVVFFTHMLLPLGIAVGLAIHLMRVTRARLLPNRIVSFSIIGGIALASFVIPAPLDQEAHMNEKVDSFTVDAWYMSPLALGLRFQQTGLWFALFGGVALSAGIPWILGKRRAPASYQAVVIPSRCHSCNQCSEDCPFDAISMIPRTDGKPFDT
ncbi:MAG: 4Fe-4S binding protein, partial [Opitutales bacterium]|nr:4Fe-4S binding protein [Opitutales bacterium]